MLTENLAQIIINDILATGQYTISHIANCTSIHEDILLEVAQGHHNPPIHYFKKIVTLHRFIKKEAYYTIFKKIDFAHLRA